MLTLPIIPRIKQQWNQGDAYFLRNNYKPYPLLDTWKGIRDRCFDPNSDAFDYYGALPHVGPLMEECYSGKFPFRYNLVAYLNFCIMIETVLGRPANENETLDKMSNVRGYGPHNLQWLDKRGQAYNRCNGKMHLSEQSTVEIRLPNISDATIKPPWTGRGNKMIMASRGKTIKPLQFKSTNSKVNRFLKVILSKPGGQNKNKTPTLGKNGRRAREEFFLNKMIKTQAAVPRSVISRGYTNPKNPWGKARTTKRTKQTLSKYISDTKTISVNRTATKAYVPRGKANKPHHKPATDKGIAYAGEFSYQTL